MLEDIDGNPELPPPLEGEKSTPKRDKQSKEEKKSNQAKLASPLLDEAQEDITGQTQPPDVEGNIASMPSTESNISLQTSNSQFNKAHEPLSEEDIALGSKPPLKTLFILSIGPFISQLTQALFGLIDTIWIQKALSNEGVTEVSTYSNFDTIGRAFGFFLNVAASSQISALFGASLGMHATQLVSDLLRVAFIFALFVPAVLIPILKPAARWFGANEHITDEGFKYILPVIACAFIPIIYLTFCGVLLAEGRTYTFGLLQIITLILNVLLFDPLFLLVFKWGMTGNALATIFAEGLPMICITTLYYMGKFGVKPKIGDLFKKFSPYTLPALKVGFSQLFYQLSLAVPGIVLRKFLGLASTEETYVDIVAGFNTQIRFYQIVLMVTAAATMGFLPCASYANGAQRYKRVLALLKHCCWISFGWTLLTMIFTVGLPKIISLMFSNEPGYLEYAEQFVRNSNIVAFLAPVALIIQALLQALQLGNKATIISISTQLLPLPIFSAVMYFTDKHNPGKLLYAYPIQQALGLLISVPLGIKPFIAIWKKAKVEKEYVDEDGRIVVEHHGELNSVEEITNDMNSPLNPTESNELQDINEVTEV